jgi:hypothetical protein
MPKPSNNVNKVEIFSGKVQHRLFVDRYVQVQHNISRRQTRTGAAQAPVDRYTCKCGAKAHVQVQHRLL